MTTKEAAKRWGISQNRVAELCNEGIIPTAYKEKRQWIIPDIDKPPASRMGLIKHLKLLVSINKGAMPKIENAIAQEIYTYLADVGFVTGMKKGKNLLESLKGVKITPLGEDLIHSVEPKYNVETETTVSVEAAVGPVAGKVEHKKIKKNK